MVVAEDISSKSVRLGWSNYVRRLGVYRGTMGPRLLAIMITGNGR